MAMAGDQLTGLPIATAQDTALLVPCSRHEKTRTGGFYVTEMLSPQVVQDGPSRVAARSELPRTFLVRKLHRGSPETLWA